MKRLFNYTPIIGLEIHVELATKSKMFCGCSSKYFGEKPNTTTCPVCLGLPGALPVPNRKAVEWAIMLGAALNCQIAAESKFDRKNYFYPDLPKGYQISQYDLPIATNGYLNLQFTIYNLQSNLNQSTFNDQKDKEVTSKERIRISRVHLEEDTGKLLHKTIKGKKVTLIDFNRSGVPLVEIVTKPDIRSSKEAVIFLKKLRQIVRYLGISDADMEKGSMRIEPNVSIRMVDGRQSAADEARQDDLPNYKVEIKNINSFKFAKNAIDYEIQRQIKLLNEGRQPLQETRGWDEKKQKTVTQRLKEEAHDYRYFPEPDIPPMQFSKLQIEKIKKEIPELPDSKIRRFIEEYKLSLYDAKILTVERELADWFEEAARAYVQTAHPGIKTTLKLKPKASAYAKPIANWIIGLMGELMKKNKLSIEDIKIQPAYLAELLYLLDQGKISQTIAKQVFVESFKTGARPVSIIDKKGLKLIKDKGRLKKIIKEVLKVNKRAVEDYKKGKKGAMRFLIGQIMQKTKGNADAAKVRILIKKILSYA